MHDINKIKETLISWLDAEVSKGRDCFDCEAAGKVTDMIKDLAETEEKCIKAEYYMYIMDVMERDNSEGRQGYDNWRYSDGRFAPTGRGHYEGYSPMKHIPEDMYDDVRMGYPNSRSNGNGNRTSNNSYGYSMDRGRTYNEYQNAKKHYTETKSTNDMRNMQDTLSNNLTDVVMQLREMSADADPEMRRRLKNEMNSVLDNLNSMM